MSEYFDASETRDPEAREAALMAALPAQVAHAKAKAPGFARILADVDPATVTSREALAALPVTRKSALIEMQRAEPPLAGLNATPLSELAQLFVSPGPIYVPKGRATHFWRFGRFFHAAGFRPGGIMHNSFAYHLTPGGHMFAEGAQAIGCAVVPGGVGNTEQQLAAIATLKPAYFGGTPSFLKILLEKAEETGSDISSMTRAVVSGEALPPSLRAWFDGRGLSVLQCYASAEFGLIAYESSAREGLILDEDLVIEILRPGTGDPVPDGEVGEVVITALNADYPLIRFATGDLSAILSGVSPCGRTNRRVKGWMGRADQTTKVKGMFVHPHQVAEVVKRHKELGRARLVVAGEAGEDTMTLRCEAASAPEGLSAAIADSLRAVTKLGGVVELVAPGSLPNDGKVIEDARSYE